MDPAKSEPGKARFREETRMDLEAEIAEGSREEMAGW